MALAPLTPDEIVERALAQWPAAIRESSAAFIRRLLDRGTVFVACRSAGIGDKEALDGASSVVVYLKVYPMRRRGNFSHRKMMARNMGADRASILTQ